MTRAMQMRCGASLLALSALLPACGGGAPPSERLVNAEAAIRGAIEIDANAAPDAELAIALARNEEMKQRAEAARTKVDRLRSGKPL